MKRAYLLMPLFLLLTGLLLSACGPGKTGDNKTGSTSDTGSSGGANSGGAIPIGAVLEKSGALENWGKQSEWGMKLALEELNGKDGITIQLFVEDNKSTPDQSANAFISLANVKNVMCVLGAVASSSSRQMKEQANKLKVPQITHASTNVQLTKETDWLFRICWNDSFQGYVCAQFAVNELKAKKAAIVTDAAQDYSRGLSRNFEETYKGLGGTVVEEVTYQTGDKMFTSQVEKLKSMDVDVIFCSGYAAEAALLLKTARESGLQKPLLGGDGLDDAQFFNIAGPHVGTGVFLCNHADAYDPNPKVQAFVKKYSERYKETPGAMSFLGYDAIHAIHDSLKRAKAKGPITRESVRDAIAQIKDLDLVTDKITMGPDHEVKKRAVVVECQADKTMKFRAEIKP